MATGRRAHGGRRPRACRRAIRGGRARQRRREPGHQANVHGPATPGDAGRPQHPWRASPREPGPNTTGAQPHGTPAAGARPHLHPSGPSRSHDPGEAPPQAGAARPVPAPPPPPPPPPPATRGGSGRRPADSHSHGAGERDAQRGAPPLGRHAPREGGRTRTRTHTGAPRAGRRPRPGGILPRLGGGRRRPR